MKARHAAAAALALAGGYLTVLVGTRHWHQHWGAADSKLDFTQAITIHAPAEQIWPWLAQMGYEGRAGTYSYDLFERSTGRNLHRIDPDLHRWPPATTMPFYPGAPMTVAVADPPLALVLWQVTVGGKAIDPAGPWGDSHVAWSWAFMLEQSMRLRPGCWSGWLTVG
jgi:hypothetical protein